MRERLVAAASAALEGGGPEAVQARTITADVGVSTQAIYTHFGGMPGLFEALVAEGFVRLAAAIESVAETDDTVADHFAKGWAIVDWARAHPQLYRLMLGLTGGDLRLHAGLEMTMTGTLANFPEGQAAMGLLIRSVDRMMKAGRIRSLDPVLVGGQFLAATHGYILLEIAGAFPEPGQGLTVIGQLAVHLTMGLGDTPAMAQQSLLTALARYAGTPAESAPDENTR